MAEPAGRGVLANRIRCQAAVRRVGPDEVVVEPPTLDDGAGLGEAGEDLLVQALVAQPAAKARDEPVLLWFAGHDVVSGEASAVVHSRMARLVISVPLSLTMATGLAADRS